MAGVEANSWTSKAGDDGSGGRAHAARVGMMKPPYFRSGVATCWWLLWMAGIYQGIKERSDEVHPSGHAGLEPKQVPSLRDFFLLIYPAGRPDNIAGNDGCTTRSEAWPWLKCFELPSLLHHRLYCRSNMLASNAARAESSCAETAARPVK